MERGLPSSLSSEESKCVSLLDERREGLPVGAVDHPRVGRVPGAVGQRGHVIPGEELPDIGGFSQARVDLVGSVVGVVLFIEETDPLGDTAVVTEELEDGIVADGRNDRVLVAVEEGLPRLHFDEGRLPADGSQHCLDGELVEHSLLGDVHQFLKKNGFHNGKRSPTWKMMLGMVMGRSRRHEAQERDSLK